MTTVPAMAQETAANVEALGSSQGPAPATFGIERLSARSCRALGFGAENRDRHSNLISASHSPSSARQCSSKPMFSAPMQLETDVSTRLEHSRVLSENAPGDALEIF